MHGGQKEFAIRRENPNPSRDVFAGRRLGRRANPTQGAIFFSTPISRFCRSVFTGLVLGGVVPSALAQPEIHCDIKPDDTGRHASNDGTVDLAWTGDAPSFELQQAEDAAFATARTRYLGPDTASVITGLREGSYYFRVREIPEEGTAGEWSAPLLIEVDYMNRARLFLLLGTGAFVASLTIGAIAHGFFKNR